MTALAAFLLGAGAMYVAVGAAIASLALRMPKLRRARRRGTPAATLCLWLMAALLWPWGLSAALTDTR